MNEIQKIENQILELTQKLETLRKAQPTQEVPDYELESSLGKTTLSSLFGDKSGLIAIHNMGQGCRYCTLWADGLNGFLPHLENHLAVALLSKDSPETQRQIANSRGWRFKMVSHAGGKYIQEQTVMPGEKNMPGIVYYEKKNGKIYRKNASVFGPGDQFCSIWNVLSLAGIGLNEFTPQFNYWRRPQKMDDGGQNLND